MSRGTVFLSLVVLFVVFGVAADEKKKPDTTKGKTTTKTTTTKPTLNTDTSTITVSEGTTAQAIRGIMGTEEPTGPTGIAVMGYTRVDGMVTARNRQSGGTFKFRVPANSNIRLGDRVDLNGSTATISGLAGGFNVAPFEPCCGVSAINTSNHTFSVSEPAVGRTFVVNYTPPDGLRIGQPVEADFKAGMAWIAGSPALKGAITSLSQPNGLHP